MNQDVTLQEMLDFREQKAACQRTLHQKYPEATLVSFGLNIPGSHKTSPDIFRTFEAGRNQINLLLQKSGLPVLEERTWNEHAGYVEYYVIETDRAQYVKNLMVGIEDAHKYGRLFDIDVYAQNGAAVSRQELGISERKCLICSKNAKECGRSRTHPVEELEKKVYEIIHQK